MNRLQTIDADTLQSTAYEPVSFVVDDLLPQGLHLLAGAPKIGKSWLALWLCLCAAQGKPLWTFATRPCEVLYCTTSRQAVWTIEIWSVLRRTSMRWPKPEKRSLLSPMTRSWLKNAAIITCFLRTGRLLNMAHGRSEQSIESGTILISEHLGMCDYHPNDKRERNSVRLRRPL